MDLYFLQLIIGFIGLTALAIPFSSNIREINYKNIIVGILFQIFLALILIKIPIIVNFFKSLGDGVIALQNATQQGTSFLFGFLILLLVSYFVEGNLASNVNSIDLNSWILISYQATVVSLGAHLLMFYLYKFYSVGKIFPFYSLFPIFGIILSYLIFSEVPTLLFILGGFIVITSVFFLHKME